MTESIVNLGNQFNVSNAHRLSKDESTALQKINDDFDSQKSNFSELSKHVHVHVYSCNAPEWRPKKEQTSVFPRAATATATADGDLPSLHERLEPAPHGEQDGAQCWAVVVRKGMLYPRDPEWSPRW